MEHASALAISLFLFLFGEKFGLSFESLLFLFHLSVVDFLLKALQLLIDLIQEVLFKVELFGARSQFGNEANGLLDVVELDGPLGHGELLFLLSLLFRLLFVIFLLNRLALRVKRLWVRVLSLRVVSQHFKGVSRLDIVFHLAGQVISLVHVGVFHVRVSCRRDQIHQLVHSFGRRRRHIHVLHVVSQVALRHQTSTARVNLRNQIHVQVNSQFTSSFFFLLKRLDTLEDSLVVFDVRHALYKVANVELIFELQMENFGLVP